MSASGEDLCWLMGGILRSVWDLLLHLRPVVCASGGCGETSGGQNRQKKHVKDTEKQKIARQCNHNTNATINNTHTHMLKTNPAKNQAVKVICDHYLLFILLNPIISIISLDQF